MSVKQVLNEYYEAKTYETMRDTRVSQRIKDAAILYTAFSMNHVDNPKAFTKPIPEGLYPIKIIVNGPATIVFWEDGTKTVVKCAKGESWEIYNAFTAALAIKVFGSNSKIKKILKTKVEWPDDFTLEGVDS